MGTAWRAASVARPGGRHSGDPAISAGIGQWGSIQTAAPSFGVEVSPNNVRDAGEIQRAVAVFALSSNRGLILATSPAAYVPKADSTSMPGFRSRPITFSVRPAHCAATVIYLARLRRPNGGGLNAGSA